MVWQKIFGRASKKASKRSTRKARNRRLLMERMERREVLASNIGAIAGVVFIDEANDGSTNGDPTLAGIQVQLFEDTNLNGTFDQGTGNDDLLIGTDISDASGNYRFDDLAIGTYFLQQDSAPAGIQMPAPVTVQVTNDAGIPVTAIDTYETATAALTVNSGNSVQTAFTLAAETIGGERDMQVTHLAGINNSSFEVDDVSDTLTLSNELGTSSEGFIQYDGTDGTIALNALGLNGADLSDGDPGAGIEVATFADFAGGTLQVRIYTSATDFSTATISLPQGTAPQQIFIPFTFDPLATTFIADGGTGADFTNVGAIEATITTDPGQDVSVSIIESRRPDVVAANLPNIQPIALGGQLFLDNSPSGQNNGFRNPQEPGVTGVMVDLYQLVNANDVVDPSSSVPLTSTVTGANGTYNFPGLDPGHYAVVVPASQFSSGALLNGFANSTGNDPAPDPDDDFDNDDNGTTLPPDPLNPFAPSAVISGTITLVSNSEPINDDDNSPNTNTTLDFGFFPQIDLSITKTVNSAASNLVAGGNVVFDMTVQNAGPLNATNVEVEDIFPAGLTFTGAPGTTPGSVNVNGSTVTVDLGTLPPGTIETFQFTADIGANQTADVTNTATVAGDEVDTNPANNSDDELIDLPQSDLTISKTDSTDPVNAGNQLTYTITVLNNGPDSASGVIVTDPLPSGVTFVSGNVPGGVVTESNGTVTASLGAVANLESRDITIVVDVAPDAASPLNNTATVTADPDTDPDPSNNSTSEDTNVQRVVDVTVDKSVAGTPIAGQNVTYTLVFDNNGPSQARGVSVIDTLDADLTFVNGSFNPGTSGVTLTQNGQQLTFDVGNLDPAASATVAFDVMIATSASGTIPNAATISTTDNDSDTSNNTDSVDIVVQRQVDLILTKDVDRSTAVPGQDQLVYSFTISHDTDSVSDAANVVITDVLPSGLIGAVITAPTADSTDFTNGTVTVQYNSIPIGETRNFTVTVDIDQAATGSVTNPASVTSDGTDTDLTNNSDDATTVMTPDFDVVVSKSVINPNPAPTSNVTYTISLTNEGPSAATGIVLSDAIPAGLTFVSGTLNGQNATSDGTTVTFPSIDLDANSSASASLTFNVSSSASGLITNTGSVPDMSADGENDITNNSDSADITVTPAADLTVSKAVSAANAQAGGTLTYTINVTNAGPSLATNVQAVDTLPSGVTFVSGSGPGGSLTESNGQVTVNGGNLDVNDSFSFTITVSIDAGSSGSQVNTVTVSSDTNESNNANNSASAATTVDPMTSTISGVVYVDLNNNGVQDPGEEGIAGVQLTLTGTDSLGNPVNVPATTDANGNYLFSNLAQGSYTVTEAQPAGFRDGIETPGTGATASVSDNVFAQLGLGADTDAVNFNFGELSEPLSKRRFLASS